MQMITLNPITDKLLAMTNSQINRFVESDECENIKAFNRNGEVLFCYVVAGSMLALLTRQDSFDYVMANLQD